MRDVDARAGVPDWCALRWEDDDGRTALHAAAYGGAADTVTLLLARGADLAVRDTRWNARPLEWALVGSGETPELTAAPDWVATVTLLLDAGAPTDELTVGDGGPKQPSPAVIALLGSRGLTGNPQA